MTQEVDAQFEQTVATCQAAYDEADRFWKPEPEVYNCQLVGLAQSAKTLEDETRVFTITPRWKILDNIQYPDKEFNGGDMGNANEGRFRALRFFVAKLLGRQPESLVEDIAECKAQIGTMCQVSIRRNGEWLNDRLDSVLEYADPDAVQPATESTT